MKLLKISKLWRRYQTLKEDIKVDRKPRSRCLFQLEDAASDWQFSRILFRHFSDIQNFDSKYSKFRFEASLSEKSWGTTEEDPRKLGTDPFPTSYNFSDACKLLKLLQDCKVSTVEFQLESFKLKLLTNSLLVTSFDWKVSTWKL